MKGIGINSRSYEVHEVWHGFRNGVGIVIVKYAEDMLNGVKYDSNFSLRDTTKELFTVCMTYCNTISSNLIIQRELTR